ncbi:MAG: WbuC family cupin fold metalloprotein [Silvanigrellales bacterium]|nr:WbuC family cupin fold metalloprotein [Silvanigrellales bacterium]
MRCTVAKLLSPKLFAEVCREAQASPRKRRNHNFHRHEEAVQRLLNALQPGTYIPPHKHEGSDKFEMFVVLQGEVGCFLFDETGGITKSARLGTNGEAMGIEIPGETYHTLVCLAPDTVILEIKEGPYTPQTAKVALPGFPDELDVLQGGEAAKKAHEHLLFWEELARR